METYGNPLWVGGKNISSKLHRRLARLQKRKTDPYTHHTFAQEAVNKSLRGVSTNDRDAARAYILGSIEPIPETYQKVTSGEIRRVANQLQTAYDEAGEGVDFELQGSALNGTAIRLHSDADLLNLTKAFSCVAPGQTPLNSYRGSPVEHLRRLRRIAIDHLQQRFWAANVDDQGSKAVSLSGGSLRRKIDLIFASWQDPPPEVQIFGQKRWIQILDNANGNLVQNAPFLHNTRLNEKDLATGGMLKPMIRLVKSIRYDSDTEVGLSSYNIAALCWNLPSQDFHVDEMECAKMMYGYLYLVSTEPERRHAMKVPNGLRSVFEIEKTVIELQRLCSEFRDLLTDAGVW